MDSFIRGGLKLGFLYIAIGGALGAVMRYWMSGFAHRYTSGAFPLGTLTVNLAGSLIIGLLWAVSEVTIISQNIRLFAFIGILGSFTTFSTFSLENFNLLRDGEYGLFFLNAALSLFLGLALVFAGYAMGRYLTGLTR
ncbi:MAG: fluoride efflux transporter CrcB [Candidatus Omnitrophota bacterium]